MSRYSKRRNVRKFWNNPLPNLCFTLAVIAIVAGVFGILAMIGKAKALSFTIISFVLAIALIIAGKKLNARGKEQKPKK